MVYCLPHYQPLLMYSAKRGFLETQLVELIPTHFSEHQDMINWLHILKEQDTIFYYLQRKELKEWEYSQGHAMCAVDFLID